jgi:hypothetical protein
LKDTSDAVGMALVLQLCSGVRHHRFIGTSMW